MEKLVYLLFDPADGDGAELRERLLEKAVPALRDAGAMDLTLNVHDDDTAAGQPMRRSDPPIRAMVSLWLNAADDREACEAILAQHAAAVAGYLVVESRPMVHDAPRGERTPGMNQVTCLSKRPDLEDDEFFRIWHHDHKQVAIETQSTFGYVRNVIVRKLTREGPDWTAIVEEFFPIGALTDPMVFYDASSADDLKARVDRMMTSCRRFLTFDDMEVTHMSEYTLG